MGGKRKRGKLINRETKFHLVFKEDERKEFLTGFRKRKDERRQKAKEEIAKVLKQERKQMKEKRQEVLSKMYYTNRDIPEFEHLVKSEIHELPNHTVTVSSITDVDFKGTDDLRLGQNTERTIEENDELQDGNENDELQDGNETEKGTLKVKRGSQKSGNMNYLLKQQMVQQMKTSKVMSLQRRMQRKKDQQKTRQKKRILKKRDKHKRNKKTKK